MFYEFFFTNNKHKWAETILDSNNLNMKSAYKRTPMYVYKNAFGKQNQLRLNGFTFWELRNRLIRISLGQFHHNRLVGSW